MAGSAVPRVQIEEKKSDGQLHGPGIQRGWRRLCLVPCSGTGVIDVSRVMTPASYDIDSVLSRFCFGQGSCPWVSGEFWVNRPLT